MTQKKDKVNEQIPRLDWKKVTWQRPLLTSEDREVVVNLLQRPDFDELERIEGWLRLGYHFKFSKFEKGLFHVSLVFTVAAPVGSQWMGTTAFASSIRGAVGVLSVKFDLICVAQAGMGNEADGFTFG